MAIKINGGSTNYASTFTASPTADRTVTVPDANTTLPIASQVLTFSGPTAARTYTLPDSASTLAALGTAQSFSAAQRGTATALTSTSASIASDFSTANNFTHTFTENTTLANPSNLVAGQSGVIVFTQHASSPKTLAFGSYWKFPGGTAPTVTATNSAVDVLVYYVESTTRISARLISDVK